MVGTMNRAIRNCDCCALVPAPEALPTVPGTLHTPPTPVDTIGNEEEAAIGPSRPPAFSVMIVWIGLACVAPIALLLTPVAFGAEDTTAGCCCRLGSRSNC
uniref:Uncharacterized protein n=1 Tax=Anopheles christyi TaxID=43041 RepID=A0A182KIF2_9DIPT